MKKVIFILVALMAVAFTSCNSSITSPYQYSYHDRSEEGEKLNYLRSVAFEEWANECWDAHPQPHSLADTSRDCPICDKYNKIFDSLDRVYKTNDTSFTSPKYDVSDVLVDFGIDKEQFLKLQEHYGVDNLMIEVNVIKDYPKFIDGTSWSKKVKFASVWIWKGTPKYNKNGEFHFDEDYEHRIFHQDYEWNEFEMKWEEISK